MAVTYVSGLLPEYCGNPLIEALPPMVREDEELLRAMAIRPNFAVAERQMPSTVRREMVSRLHDLFIPLPPHFGLFERISTCLRRSYTWRNPLLPQTQAYLHRTGAALPPETMTARAAAGSVLFVKGVSGIGKSTGIEACLRALGPCVIRHERYKETRLLETQIVWLKISCPEDRSLKSLCIAILAAVDGVLGTEGQYTADYCDDPRITTGTLTRGVMQCLANHHVGVLVVDELQNVFASKGLPGVELLNFLLRIRDESGICLTLCGTYASLHLLQDKFRLGRRLAAGGTIELRRPSAGNDDEWLSFCEILWDYQWVKTPQRFCKSAAATLFDLTQGIRGLAVPLFIRAQEDAIASGREIVKGKSLRDTWRRHFSELDPAMAALRANDPRALAQWDDLCDAVTLASMDRFNGKKVIPPSARPTLNECDDRHVLRKALAGDGTLDKLLERDGLDKLRAAGVVGVPRESEVAG